MGLLNRDDCPVVGLANSISEQAVCGPPLGSGVVVWAESN